MRLSCYALVSLLTVSVLAQTPDAPFAMRGVATVRTSPSGHIIGVQLIPDAGPIHYLRFQTEATLQPIVIEGEQASIEWRGTEASVILYDSGTVLTLALNSDDGRPASPSASATRFVGYGLSHAFSPRPAENGRAKVNGNFGAPTYVPWGEEAGGTTCTSGGLGSNSCSVSCSNGGCSVSCVPGYYACCQGNCWQLPSCSCKKL